MQSLAIVLRVIPDEGPRMLLATFAGLLGYGGINSAGVGYMMNALANSTWRMGCLTIRSSEPSSSRMASRTA